MQKVNEAPIGLGASIAEARARATAVRQLLNEVIDVFGESPAETPEEIIAFIRGWVKGSEAEAERADEAIAFYRAAVDEGVAR